jgi:hypothetical protein
VQKVVVQKVPVQICRYENQEVVEKVPVTVCKVMQEEQVRKVPFTVCKQVVEHVDNKVPVQVCKMIPETQVRKVQYQVCKIVNEEHVDQVPVQVCKMMAYEDTVRVPQYVEKRIPVTYTQRTPRTIVMKVPIDPCTGRDLVTPMVPVRPAPPVGMQGTPTGMQDSGSQKTFDNNGQGNNSQSNKPTSPNEMPSVKTPKTGTDDFQGKGNDSQGKQGEVPGTGNNTKGGDTNNLNEGLKKPAIPADKAVPVPNDKSGADKSGTDDKSASKVGISDTQPKTGGMPDVFRGQ